MKQIISRNGKVLCTTLVPYPKDIILLMKDSGHTVEIEKDKSSNNANKQKLNSK